MAALLDSLRKGDGSWARREYVYFLPKPYQSLVKICLTHYFFFLDEFIVLLEENSLLSLNLLLCREENRI